jgi:hypothetical protein
LGLRQDLKSSVSTPVLGVIDESTEKQNQKIIELRLPVGGKFSGLTSLHKDDRNQKI